MSRIEELEKQAKAILEEIEKLKKEEAVWKPKEGELFYEISGYGCVDSQYFHNQNVYSNGYLKMGNCFKTKEEAEAVLDKIKNYIQLKRLAEEINTEPIDWKNDDQSKCRIGYSWENNTLFQDCNYALQGQGTIYSTNRDFLKIAKQHIGEENLLKLFKE